MSLKRPLIAETIACHMIIGILLVSEPGMAQSLRTPTAAFWQGESFNEAEGGVLFQIMLNQNLSRYLIEVVVVKLYLPPQARQYLLQRRPALQSQGAAQVWRLPAGKYRPHEIEFLGKNGYVIRWNGEDQQEFLIQSGSLANFGRWYAIALPDKQVRVMFREPNPAEKSPPPPPANTGTPGAGISAAHASQARSLPESTQITPRCEARIEDKSLSQGSRPLSQGPPTAERLSNNEPKGQDLRAVYQFQKKLDLLYQVNLMRDNRYSRVFVATIKRNEAELRKFFWIDSMICKPCKDWFDLNSATMDQNKLSRA